MKSIKLKVTILVGAMAVCLAFIIFGYCIPAKAEKHANIYDGYANIENYSGYGCGSSDPYHCEYIVNNDIESTNGLGCDTSYCGDGRENGYSTAFLSSGCRNWQIMPMYTPFYRYYIDESTLSGLSETEKINFIDRVHHAVNLWNSCSIHDGSNSWFKLTETQPNALFISGETTCPVGFNPELENKRGEFIPVPFFHRISLKYNDNTEWNFYTAVHELGHLLGLQDLDMNITDNPIHNSLMGYGNNRKKLTYHDIQGVAVANKIHTAHEFRRYVYDGGKYKHLCFYCDVMDIENEPEFGSKHLDEAQGCLHDYCQLVSAGEIHWLKCSKCYKVIETTWTSNSYPNDGNLEYTLDGYNYIVTQPVSKTSEVVIPPTFNGRKVVGIKERAFADTTVYKNVIIADGIKYIGNSAFSNSKITEIDVSGSVENIGDSAFENCTELSLAILSEGLKEIGNRAFFNCDKLDHINFPSTVTIIGKEAFKYCRLLFFIDMSSNYDISLIQDETFAYCNDLVNIILPPNITEIGDAAFYATGLNEINIPHDVVEIGSSAFGYCLNLEKVLLPDAVSHLGSCAFINCIGLSNVKLSNKISRINDGVFMNCVNLKSMEFHEGITYIGEQAFRFSGLSTLTLPFSVKRIEKGAFKDCENLMSIDFFYGIEEIGEEAFSGCTSLKAAKLPFTVNVVECGAFRGCTSMISAELSDEVVSIPDYLFYGCGKLQTVLIKNKTEHIGSYAFYGCGIKEFIMSENIIDIGENAFENSLIEKVSAVPSNKYFATQNGILYDIAKTSIIYVPNKINTGATIPRSVSSIERELFLKRDELLSVTIPRNVLIVGSDVFRGCSKLTIYVDSYTSKPSGWNSNWNIENRPVVWGCNLNNADAVTSMNRTINNIQNKDAVGGINAPYWEGYFFEGWAIREGFSPSFSAQSIANLSLSKTVYAIWTDLAISNFKFTLLESGNAYEIGVRSGVTITGDILIPEYYNDLPIIRIADYGFSDDYSGNAKASTKDMTSVTLPKRIVEIGKFAFSSCIRLTSLNVSEDSLLNNIGVQAFNNCQALRNISIPKNVKSIGALCFSGCFNLSNITFDQESQLTTIGNNAFDGCVVLTNIIIPNSVTSIGAYLFDACRELKNVILPQGITILPEGIFSGCWGLENMTIPDTVVTIKKNAFSNCALKDIVIPASVKVIEEFAFRSCNPDSITVKSGNTAYKSLSNCLIKISNNILIYGSNNSVIPDNVTKIDDYAFYGCEELQSVTIPDSVKEIGYWAFNYCKKLQTVTISGSSNLIKIDDSAFSSTAISNIRIPSKVEFIGSGVFSGCKMLKNVSFDLTNGWTLYNFSTSTSGIAVSSSEISNSVKAAEYLTRNYMDKVWKRQ